MIQDRLLMFGVAGLAAVATAGWMRNPVPATAHALMPPVIQEVQAPMEILQEPAPVYAVRRATPIRTRMMQERYPVQNVSSTRRAPVAYDDREYRPQRRERSKMKSAAIIGGGAAAGAAIGGMAGGGKGAAIGAVGGGAAGLVYDRMTRDKDSRQDVAYRSSRESRSTGKSAAIVGGSAAAGAAVGAAAGGGKGAAIGALGGGAAGYIYDRMTRNK
ncbi:MAG TPA: hypothetical protein VES20_09830 [Bryobacteraceae bacterium]|nr:hypothetical protein [Bryobacteraceae bacterium]